MIQTSPLLQPEHLTIEPPVAEQLDALLDACRRALPTVGEEMIRRAFRLAYWAHRDDRRATGELYIMHPLAVARIYVEEIAFDDVSVAAALLHDVVEDTEITLGLLEQAFGTELATIVDGLTKIRGVFASREIGQAENVRKLMLSMASDIRVILIKFADRVHNMRTIEGLPAQKQLKIAHETLDLFAPLAHRFGLFRIKSEMEDLSLRIIYPEAYYEIATGLQATKQEREAYLENFMAPLRARLKEEGFDFDIYGRPKNIYSIYRKMRRQEKTLEEIYDLMAVRIVIKMSGKKARDECWRAYSVVTDTYTPLPERFHDFISTPKSNGYQSLHTTVLGPDARRVEVQVRTQDMHDVAERGVAAHWKYKEGLNTNTGRFDEWLSWVRDLLETPRTDLATEFVQDFRLNLYDAEIYIFTPKGEVVTLPRDATPVDFAFQVHTEVGFHCIGAKVNGKMVPLSYKLKSGDQVEIITSKKQTPNPDWNKFVVTHKARARIRQWVNEKRRKAVELGREVWEKKAKKAGLETHDGALRQQALRLKFSSQHDLFEELGKGAQDADELIHVLKNGAPREEDTAQQPSDLQRHFAAFIDTAQQTGSPALIIDGEQQTHVATEYAACCSPIPGDEVFGYVSKTGAIKIHRTSCRNAPHLLVNHADRIVQVEWSRHKDVSFIVALRVMGEDRVGIVSDLTTVISKNLKTNIRSITVNSEEGFFDGTVVLFVNDLGHLRRIIDRLKRIEGIYGVYRREE